MRWIALTAAATWFAAPAFAITYHFDYSVGSSTGGTYFDREADNSTAFGTGDVVVTGFIETDDTIGIISAANILDWGFTISGEEGNLTISSTPTFGDGSYSSGTFIATLDTLTATSSYQFYEWDNVYNSEGYFEEYLLGQIWGHASTFNDSAEIWGWDRDCVVGLGCTPYSYTGERGSTYSNATQFVGMVSPVPLPAGLPLLLAGLGGLAVIRRKRR